MKLAQEGYNDNKVDSIMASLEDHDLTITEVRVIINLLRDEIRKELIVDEQA